MSSPPLPVALDDADIDAANAVGSDDAAAPGLLTQGLQTLRAEASRLVEDGRPSSPPASPSVDILDQLLGPRHEDRHLSPVPPDFSQEIEVRSDAPAPALSDVASVVVVAPPASAHSPPAIAHSPPLTTPTGRLHSIIGDVRPRRLFSRIRRPPPPALRNTPISERLRANSQPAIGSAPRCFEYDHVDRRSTE